MGNKTILLVEDESVTSIVTTITLQKFGYDVLTADSGVNAVDTAASNKNIDLILMDIDLGEGIDGTEAAAIILKDRDIPVVFLSSHTEPEIVEKTEKITSYGYVVKNSSTTVLDASIKMAFKLFDANQKIKNELAERKLAEENLSHARTTWDKTFNSMSDIVCMISLDHTFLAINETGMKSLGLPKEKIIGRKCYELIHGTGCPIDTCPCSMALHSGKEEFSEFEQDGKNYILQASPMHDNSGKIISFVHNIKEITERRKSDKTIERQNSIFDTLLNNLQVGVMMIEAPSGKPIVVNEQAVMLLGRGILPDTSKDNLATIYKAVKAGTQESYPEKDMPLIRGLSGEFSSVDDMVIERPDGTKTLLEVFGSPLFDKKGNVWASIVSFSDITKQKQAEESLKAAFEEIEQTNEELNAAMEEMEASNEELLANSEELQERESRLRSYFEMPMIGIAITSPEKGWLEINNRTCGMLGYSSSELKQMTWAELTHPDDLPADVEQFNRIVSGVIDSYVLDKRFIRKDGRVIWTTLGVNCVRNVNRSLKYTVAVLTDITDRKLAEEALRESEDKFKYLFDHSIVGNSLTLITGEVNANQSLCEMLGYTLDEFNNKKWQEFTHPDDIELTQSKIDQLYTGKLDSARFNKRFIHKNGSVVWVDLSSSLRRDKDGKPLYLMSSIIEITNRMQMEEKLIMSNIMLEQTFDQSPIPKVLVSMPGAVLQIINPACREFLGIMDEPSYIGTSLLDFNPTFKDYDVNGNPGNVSDLPLARALAGQTTTNEERRIVRKDGTERWELVNAVPIYNFNGEVIAGYLNMIDITERKMAEIELRRSDERYAMILNAVNDGFWDWSIPTGSAYFSSNYYAILGYEDNEFPADYASWRVLVHSEDIDRVEKDLQSSIETGIGFAIDLRMRTKSGEWLWVSTRGKAVELDAYGKALRMVGTLSDITERKNYEEKLIESKLLLNETEKAGKIGGWTFDVETLVQTWTEETFHILEIDTSKGEPEVPEGVGFITPEYRPMAERAIQRAIESGEPYDQEWEVTTDKGNKRWVHSIGKAYKQNGRTIRLSGSFQDITERKRIEDENKLNESRLRKLVDILQHPAGTIQEFLDYALEQALQLTGSKIGYIYHYNEERKQLILNSWSKDVMPNCAVVNPQTCYDLDKTGIWGEAVRQRKPIYVNDYQADNPLKKGYPEGHVKLLKFITIPIFRGESIVSVVGLANKETDYLETDVLQVSLLMDSVWKVIDRMQAEEAVRESEEKYRLLHESAGIGIGYYNIDGIVISYNQKAAKNMGGIPEDFNGKSIYDIFPKQEAEFYHNRIKKAALENEPAIYEDFVPLPSGDKYFFSTFSKISDANNNITGVQIISQDITERKLAEEKIKSLLSEKDIILREVNHRIKNNMNVIHGLLMLQSYEMKDPLSVSALEDSAMRVQSMMILYDKLYRNSDVQNFSVMDYISSLADEIVSNFPDSNTVEIRKKIDDFILDAKRLQTIGIIINELLSNIMKYAFVGRKNGIINLGVSLIEKNISIAVEDNGLGMPESVNFENSTGFGLKLVGMLTKELHGSISIVRKKGTRIILKFEL